MWPESFCHSQVTRLEAHIQTVRTEIERLMTFEEQLIADRDTWQQRIGATALHDTAERPHLVLINGGKSEERG